MPANNTQSNRNPQPVTLVFTFKVKKGKEKEFEKWAHKITHALIHYKGHLGSNWIKPGPNCNEYAVIYKFTDLEHFHHWEQSATRKRFLEEAEPLIEPHGSKRLQQITGLETWFSLPGEITVKPPARWKMVIATTIGIYPIGLIYQAYLIPYMLKVPLLLRPIVLSMLLSPALTYVIMPKLTKLLRKWLYPSD